MEWIEISCAGGKTIIFLSFTNTTVSCVMTHPKNISIQDYTYQLPEERIARYPLEERDASKLLIYKNGQIAEDTYRNIASHIHEKTLLVFNNTKVVEARLLFQKPTGGTIEIFCLEPHEQYPDITSAMLQKGKVYWSCLVGGASKWKPGQVLSKKITRGSREILLEATCIEKRHGSFIIKLNWLPAELSFAELLHLAGAIPLPPYINRLAEETDKERYQTVYAKMDGSVAAPTAGLHFTDTIFTALKNKNIQTDFVTLHVSAGTFKPVKSQIMQDHDMHAEWIDVGRPVIENMLHNLSNNIVAVGTTSLRTVESLYWMGVKSRDPEVNSQESIQLTQWEAYEPGKEKISPGAALESLLEWMDKHKTERLVSKTQLLVAPGYDFKIISGLVTNFHQPQSTLLLLVAALIGADWRKVYSYAMENHFRFLSYGDGCLLWKR